MKEWRRSYECVSMDGEPYRCGSFDTPVEKAILKGAIYTTDEFSPEGLQVYRVLAAEPEYRHFEETGWLRVKIWRGTAWELVREGIEIDSFLNSFVGIDDKNRLEVFGSRYGRLHNDVWTLKGHDIYKNWSYVGDFTDSVLDDLGWIVRRMSEFRCNSSFVLPDELPSFIEHQLSMSC